GRWRAKRGLGDLRDEGVAGPTAERRLERPHGRREVGRTRETDNVGVRGRQRVYRDAGALVEATAAEVGGVDEPGAGRVHLGHEDVKAAAGGGLDRIHGREDDRCGYARNVGFEGCSHRDAGTGSIATAVKLR